MREINEVVIHHTAVSNKKQPDSFKQISSMERSHKARLKQPADKNGSHIAYHYVVDTNGGVHPSRDHESFGYHASNLEVNKKSIGVCMIGNFDEEKPTKAQIAGVKHVIKVLKEKYGKLKISFHRDYANKSCPGANVEKIMFMDEYIDKPNGNENEARVRAKNVGLLNGERPNDPITREEFAIVLKRFYDMVKPS